MVEEGKQWTVPQLASLTETESRLAHTIQTDGQTWGDRQSREPRASRIADHLLHLPHVVDDELLRVSPGGEGQHQKADAAQRGRREPGLRLVQPGDSPHRRLHARRRRHDHGKNRARQSHCAGPIVERGDAERAERHARLGRQSGADRLVGRVHRQRLQHARAAHRPRTRNQAVHRLPRVARRRQQRVDGVGPHAGHQPGQLHGPLHLRRAGERRSLGRRGDRTRSSRRRSTAATCSRSRIRPTSRRTSSAAAGSTKRCGTAGARSRCSSTASICWRRRGPTGSRCSTSRSRQQGLRAADRHVAVRDPAHEGGDEKRDRARHRIRRRRSI